MPEIPRIFVFTTVDFEDGDWDGPHRDDDILTYKSKNATASLKITHNGATVFDKDFPKNKTFTVVGDVIHIPEGALPEV
ncbi:MAG: hypothetical protein ACJ74W_11730 [Pyrinomonadaceae bacterium]